MTLHRSLAWLTLPFHTFLNKCLPAGLTDHLICLLSGAEEGWKSRGECQPGKCAYQSCDVFGFCGGTAATGLGTLLVFTADINLRGLACLCEECSECGMVASINATGLNPHITLWNPTFGGEDGISVFTQCLPACLLKTCKYTTHHQYHEAEWGH